MSAKKTFLLFTALTMLVVLAASLVFPQPVLAGANPCNASNEWYGISGTQAANGAYIGQATLSMASNCQWVVLLRFIVDGQFVYSPVRNGSNTEYYTISSVGAHTITFFFDTGASGQYYGPFDTTLVIDQPPTISGSAACNQWGQNGWCRDNARLVLAASDPQGYGLTITGSAGSASISCGGSCTVSLPPGAGTANYTVTAAASGMTASGSTAWSYDPGPPIPSLSLSGTSGANGWYTSAVGATAGGSDAISGLAGATLSVDGGAASPSATVATDGVHTVSETAADKAGNSASASASVKVDTNMPQVNAGGATGTPGLNGWYISPVQLSATASDATSGLASFNINIDGTWQPFASPVALGEGQHAVQFQAADNAGNVSATAAYQYKVDTTLPVITSSAAGTSGSNDWYTSSVQAGATAADLVSGINALNIAVDGGAWIAYTAPVSLPDGQHSIKFQAADNAGNSASTALSIKVDTTAPTVTPAISGTSGTNGWYASSVQLSADAADNGSGVSSTQVSVDGGAWQTVPVTVSAEGQHSAAFRAYDNAGNTSSSSASFKIDLTPPAAVLALSGTPGNNGWYVSTVAASVTASDAGSGIAGFQYRVDGGAWQGGDTVTLDNGIHAIDFQASDQAGNVQLASETVRVDTAPPQIDFSSALSGAALSGDVALSGQAIDEVSGLISADVSTDNGLAWQQAVFKGSGWRSTWPTGSLPNGAYTVLLRASDNAGNRGSTSTGLIVDNQAPIVGLSGWSFPGAGYVEAVPNVWPIASVKVSVRDFAGLWDDQIYSSAGSGPLAWSGRFFLLPGAYPLRAEVCDIYGLCAKAESSILVSISPTATPTATPAATQKPAQFTFQRPPTLVPTKAVPAPQPQIVQAPPPAPISVPAPPAETPFAPIAVGFLTLLSSALLILDPRPRAWRNFTLTARQGIKKQEDNKK
ncbi:MAG: Ig-like domain repeat protein [Chloroflexi bacterium]|nr:Ig-like domain repeat protein [Chloroflexota bacterium]